MTSAESIPEQQPAKSPYNLRDIPFWVYPALIAVGSLSVTFWPLFRYLPAIWFADDTYYAHGVVIPICSALIVWDRWDKLKVIPVKGSLWGLVGIAGVLYVLWFALRTEMHTFESLLLIFLLAASSLFVAGWRWLLGMPGVGADSGASGLFPHAPSWVRRSIGVLHDFWNNSLAVPIGYLVFALPMWDHLIDSYTLRTQMASTNFSVWILKVVGLHPFREDATTIHLDNFTLDVGVACSGMKLVLAVSAISVFFMIVAKLRWWGNAVLIASILPLSLLVNSIRIVMIAWVGNTWGSAAGKQFHDYSGYISLVICFLALMKLTRVLGWK